MVDEIKKKWHSDNRKHKDVKMDGEKEIKKSICYRT